MRPHRFPPSITRMLCIGFLAGSAVSAFSQAAAGKNVGAYASIVQPLTITRLHNLMFGYIVSDSVGGTVVVAPDGSRTSTGPVLLAQSTTESTFQAAQFTVSGAPNFVYTIILPASGQTISAAGGPPPTMTVDTFTSTPSGVGLLTAGTSTLRIGATLHVQAGKTAGAYSGSFNVIVAYQ